MKKYLSRIVCAVAVAAIAAYGVYTHQKGTQVSNLTLANVEALDTSVELDIGQCGSLGTV